MFSKFFRRSERNGGQPPDAILDGAYRRHKAEDVEYFTQLARDAYPKLSGRIQCFGADWLGNQFASDRGRVVNGFPQVLLLEPGTGQALEIPADVESFHKAELITQADAAVAYSFYKKWLASGGARPGYNQCAGYKKPLYLGGEDEVTNLVLSDLDVYWTLAAQLLAKVRGLPVGTPIGRASIGD